MLSFKAWATNKLEELGITVGGTKPGDVSVHDDRVYMRVGVGGAYCLGNTYVDGWWDCEALDEFFEKASRADLQMQLSFVWDRIRSMRDFVLNTQNVRRALEVGLKHYDLGNELYKLMLGPSMAYSSAYFSGGAKDLEQAQYAKFEKICVSLDLKPGMRVLEVGCGWGTFARFASERFGVRVVGISISEEQLRYARIHNEGTDNEFHFVDYRQLPDEWNGTFDVAVSIEMIEAVGPKNFKKYFESAHRALKENGAFALQVIIGGGVPDVWISTHIFPNGVLPSVNQLATAINGRFDIRSWESFGPDYDTTLMEWHRRFERAWPEISQMKAADGSLKYDARFRRMWRYYLLQCAGLFRSRHIDVAQILLARR